MESAPRRLTAVVLAGEGLLVLVALVWSGVRQIPLTAGASGAAVRYGCVAAVGLAAVTWLMLQADTVPVLRNLGRIEREMLAPLFARVNLGQIVMMSAAAGLGEEMVFRGVMQAELGWMAASVIFGAAHFGGAVTLTLAVWATIAGGLFSGLAIMTGGLTAPIVAHAVYDSLALSYIRWRPRQLASGS